MAVKEFDSTADTRMSLERSPLASPEAEPPPARLDEEAPEIALAFSETVLTTRSLEEADELDPEKVASLIISTLIEDVCANGAGTESEHSASSSDTPGTPTVTAEDAEIYATPMLPSSNVLMQQLDARADQQAAAMEVRSERRFREMQQMLLQGFSTQKEELKAERAEDQASFLQEQPKQLTQFRTQVAAEVTDALQDNFDGRVETRLKRVKEEFSEQVNATQQESSKRFESLEMAQSELSEQREQDQANQVRKNRKTTEGSLQLEKKLSKLVHAVEETLTARVKTVEQKVKGQENLLQKAKKMHGRVETLEQTGKKDTVPAADGDRRSLIEYGTTVAKAVGKIEELRERVDVPAQTAESLRLTLETNQQRVSRLFLQNSNPDAYMFLHQHVSVAEALDYTYNSVWGLHEKHDAHMQQHASAEAVSVAEQAGIKAWKTDTDRRLHSLEQGSQASDKPLHPHGQLHKQTDSEDCLFRQFDEESQKQFAKKLDSEESRDFLRVTSDCQGGITCTS